MISARFTSFREASCERQFSASLRFAKGPNEPPSFPLALYQITLNIIAPFGIKFQLRQDPYSVWYTIPRIRASYISYHAKLLIVKGLVKYVTLSTLVFGLYSSPSLGGEIKLAPQKQKELVQVIVGRRPPYIPPSSLFSPLGGKMRLSFEIKSHLGLLWAGFDYSGLTKTPSGEIKFHFCAFLRSSKVKLNFKSVFFLTLPRGGIIKTSPLWRKRAGRRSGIVRLSTLL